MEMRKRGNCMRLPRETSLKHEKRISENETVLRELLPCCILLPLATATSAPATTATTATATSATAPTTATCYCHDL